MNKIFAIAFIIGFILFILGFASMISILSEERLDLDE